MGTAWVPTRVVRPRDVHFVAAHPRAACEHCADDARRGSPAIPFAPEPVQLFGVDVFDASQQSAASRVDDQQRLVRLAPNDDGDA